MSFHWLSQRTLRQLRIEGKTARGVTQIKEAQKVLQPTSCWKNVVDFRTRGINPYFILEPGYLLVLEGKEGKKTLRIVITVLGELKTVTVDIGGVPTAVDTRVIEERETEDDVLVEVSINYFAICDRTNSVMYFGEAVDIYDDTGTIVITWTSSVVWMSRPCWRRSAATWKPGYVRGQVDGEQIDR